MSTDLAGRGTAEWENATLGRFLEALSACIEGAQDGATWSAFAKALATAAGYE